MAKVKFYELMIVMDLRVVLENIEHKIGDISNQKNSNIAMVHLIV